MISRERCVYNDADVDALRDQIERAGCAVSRAGETTYECRPENVCGLCRLRNRAERAEAEVERVTKERDEVVAENERLRALEEGDPWPSYELRQRAERAEALVAKLRAIITGDHSSEVK